MDLKQAIENRKNFLKPYREKFEKAKKPKERAKIISKLIELEPSHLSENWIICEVITWMRDRNCLDFLKDVFIKAPKRKVLSEGRSTKFVRDYFTTKRVDEIIKEQDVSVREACRIFAQQIYDKENKYLYDTTNPDRGLEKSIRQDYNNAKRKKKQKSKLPYPYYGRDIEMDENEKITIFGGR